MVWLQRLETDRKLIEHLRRELTIIPRKPKGYGGEKVKPTPIKCYVETSAEFGVPRAFWFGSSERNYDYEWDLSFGQPIAFPSKLRHTGTHAEQQIVIDRFMSRYDNMSSPDVGDTSNDIGLNLGGIFQADTGFGKTNTALGLLHKLGRTTLILVHKEFLLKQWVRRIEQFMPEAEVGIVQGGKCDIEGKDIVLGMMQSLALEDGTRYPPELYTWPGFLIIDETHRVGAQTWAPIPAQFNAAYRLGLTATPRRKDGADKVFWWHLGEVAYRAKKVMPKPHVRIIQVPVGEKSPDILRRPDTSPAIIMNVLVKMTRRNRRVVREIVKCLEAPSGRKVMVLSERLEHLRELSTMLKSELGAGWTDVPMGFYVGEWFTGETEPALKKGQWEMDEEGRAAAILTIYRSLSRRKLKDAEGNKLSAGDILVDEETKEKTHLVGLFGTTVNALRGLVGSEAFDDDTLVPVVLQTLTDEEIFQLAREFKIRQKSKEKKKTQTDDDLYEAEQARVIFATYQMCSEGVDLPAVDTLVLASPVADVEQAVGRSRRECLPEPGKCAHYCRWRAGVCKGKPNPIVADLVDVGVPLATRRRQYREDYYSDSGFKVATGS